MLVLPALVHFEKINTADRSLKMHYMRKILSLDIIQNLCHLFFWLMREGAYYELLNPGKTVTVERY